MDFTKEEYVYILSLVEDEKRKHEMIHLENDTLSFLNSVLFKLKKHVDM